MQKISALTKVPPEMSIEEKQYHWVHKSVDSKQFSRSEGEEATSILRFAQQGRKPVHKQRLELRKSSQHDFVAFRSRKISSQTSLEQNSRPEDLRALKSRWRLEIPRHNFTPASGMDPFQASVVPIDAAMHQILQYMRYNLTIGAGGYKLEVFPTNLRPMGAMYEAATQYLFRNLVHFEFIIYPALGAFSRRLDRLSPEHVHRPWQSDQFMQLAMRAVRESITERSNQLSYVATGVHFLICSAGLDDRYEESNMHIRAFMRFLPHINTNSAVGYWELDSVSYWDILNAAATGRAPFMRVATGDPGPMSSSRAQAFQLRLTQLKNERSSKFPDVDAIASDRSSARRFDMMSNPSDDLDVSMGSALEIACQSSTLPLTIILIVQEILGCLAVAKVIWKSPGFADKSDTQWLCRRVRAVIHRLLSLTFRHSGAMATPEVQAECLRLTLIIVLISAQSRLLHQSRQLQAARLRSALSQLLSTQDKAIVTDPHIDIEMLFWMLVMGHWAAKGLPDEEWFAGKAILVLGHISPEGGLEGMRTIVLKYLYANSVQSNSLAELASILDTQKR